MDSKIQFEKGVYLGERKNDFKNFLNKIFENAKLQKEHISFLLNKENFIRFSNAFTCETVDVKNNYEYSEHIGDGFFNAFLVSYIYRKFPKFQSSECVKIVARLKINYVSKNELAKIAEDNGFWNYISADISTRQTKKKKLLEDTLEAFIGTVVQIMNEFKDEYITKYNLRIGYSIAEKILEYFFEKVVFSFKYEDLYDSITRLKELRDMLPKEIGTLETRFERKEQLVTCQIVRTVNAVYQTKQDGTSDFNKIVRGTGRQNIIAVSVASIQPDAEQKASEIAIETLRKEGLVKHPPRIYSNLNDNEAENKNEKETTMKDVLRICQNVSNINLQFQTKGKKNKYTCTPIFHFIQSEDITGFELCLNNGADPNLTDVFGLTCLDAVLIKRNPDLFKKIWKMCKERKIKLDTHEYVLKYFTDSESVYKLVNVKKDF